jgi:hypothetical protein
MVESPSVKPAKVALPFGVTTSTEPVLPVPTIANNLVFELNIKLVEVPPKETDDVLNKLVPLIVMVSPGKPSVGENDVIVGGGGVPITKALEILKKILLEACINIRALSQVIFGIVIVSLPSFKVLFIRV